MPNPMVYWEIGGKDIAKLRNFYTQLFNWRIADDGTVDTGEGLAGGMFEAEDAYVYIAFGVLDPGTYATRAERLGGKVVTPANASPDSGFAMIEDPEGNHVGLMKQ